MRREEREKYSKRITNDNATGLRFECKIRARRFHSGEERQQQNTKKIFCLLREVWGPLSWERGPWTVLNGKGAVSGGRLCAEDKEAEIVCFRASWTHIQEASLPRLQRDAVFDRCLRGCTPEGEFL